MSSYDSAGAQLLRRYATDNPQRVIWDRDRGWIDVVTLDPAPAPAVPAVREYTPHSGRAGYSVSSVDGRRAYMVTPDCGPGKFSPVRAWLVWKSDSVNTAARFPATVAGRDKAIARAVELATD